MFSTGLAAPMMLRMGMEATLYWPVGSSAAAGKGTRPHSRRRVPSPHRGAVRRQARARRRDFWRLGVDGHRDSAAPRTETGWFRNSVMEMVMSGFLTYFLKRSRAGSGARRV